MTGPAKTSPTSSMLPFWIRHECAGASSSRICGGDSLEALRVAAWRLVMVPETRRGERGQEPAALEQGHQQAPARPLAQIPLRLI